MESLDFDFVHLDNFIGLSRLADKKRQETKQTYCIDKQKIKTTKIIGDCITTERPAANTRLSTIAEFVQFWSFITRISFCVVRQ